MNRQSFITILLTILMSMTGAKAFAHDIEAVNNDGVTIYYVWKNNKTKLAVSYRGSSYDSYNEYTGNVVIPESVDYNGNTYPVTSIGDHAFYECRGLTSVTIPNSVTSIGNYAFGYCSGLTSVTIPNSVTSIGSQAFWGCSTLNSLTIPENVTSIGIQAFNYCGNLTSITVENGNTKYDSRENCNAIIERNTNKLLFGCMNTIIPNSVNYIEEFAFFGCKSLTSMTIPSSVSSIGQYAFSDCSGLISMTINDGVTSIGVTAFKDCSSLTSITIPNSVVSIGGSAFWNCQGLTSITIPANVSTIGGNIFVGCQNMSEVIVSQDNTKYASEDGVLFNKDKTELICYPEGKQSSLYSIPTSVTKISGFAFHGSTFLSTILCPKNLRSIGNSAFGECTSLETIVIPWRVQSIGGFAFSNCKSLLSITSESKAPFDIEDNVFWGNQSSNPQENVDIYSTATLYVPTGTKALYQSKTGWGNFKNIEEIEIVGIDTKRTIHVATAGTLPDLISEEEKYDIEELTITGELNGTDFRLLRDMAGCNYLGEETIGLLKVLDISNAKIVAGGEKYIDADQIPGWQSSNGFRNTIEQDDVFPKYAFASCKVVSVNIPNTVTSIESGAFFRCSGLTSFTIPNTVTSIGDLAFSRCSGITSITIPGSVTNIGYNAFGSISGLTSLNIPSSVTNISNYAFSNCSGITSIIVATENTKYDSRNGCNAIIETATNTLILGCINTSIPNGVMVIGDGAFQGSHITSLTIPNSVTNIGGWSFMGCNGLSSITFPNSLTNIGTGAFRDCSNLTSMVIPKSVRTIGGTVFMNCGKLTSVVSYITTPFEIDENVFSDYTKPTLTVPYGRMSAYQTMKGWKNFEKIEEMPYDPSIEPENIVFASDAVKAICVANWDTNNDGELNMDEAAAVKNLGEVFKGNTTITSFDELQYFTGLTEIAEKAFDGCSGLTSITIPNSVTSVGGWAFNGCSGLTSVTIGNSVTSIGVLAFNGCSGLTSVTIGNRVTSIGIAAFQNCSGLTSITIPNSVTSIGSYAFYNCSSLTSITSKIEEPFAINENVFSNKNALLKVPAGTKSLYEATDGWKSFKNIVEASSLKRTIHVATAGTLPDLISEDEKYQIEELTLTGELNGTDFRLLRDMAGNNYLGKKTNGKLKYLDMFNTKIVSGGLKYLDTKWISWENGGGSVDKDDILYVESNVIPCKVFAGCSINTIIIPNTVETICDHAFWRSQLKTIVISNSVLSIEGGVFDGCKLQSLTIPSSVTSIETPILSWNNDLEIIKVDEKNSIYDSRDNCNAIIETQSNTLVAGCKKTKIPNSVTTIGSCAFLWCESLTSITIPNLVGAIENQAFYGCNGLTSVTIPNSVTSIGGNAFQYCSGLTSVTIGSSVESITESHFSGCSGLTSITVESGNQYYDSRNNCNAIIETASNTLIVGCKSTTIPNSVTSINKRAFYGCSGLTSVTIPNSVTSIGSYAFSSCRGLTSITIPNSVTSIARYAFNGCSGLSSINVESGNPNYDSRNNCNAIIETASNRLIVGCKNTTIPNSVKSIDVSAFEGCSGLTSVTIPNGVTSIDGSAFQNCGGLTSVTIPNGVKSIGSHAFSGCSSLTSITSEIEEPFAINENVFSNKNALLKVPAGTKSLYEATDGWKSFKNIVEVSSLKRTIHVATAGTLSSLIPADMKYQIEELTLSGELNGTDIHFIRDMAGINMDNMKYGDSEFMPGLYAKTNGQLRVLDLSDAIIVEGGRDYYRMLTSDVRMTFDYYQYTKPNEISDRMFDSCWKLEELTLPSSVTSISSFVFGSASPIHLNIKSLKVADGNPNYESPGDCKAIIEKETNTLILGCSNSKIPESVASIGYRAFYGCGDLTYITIPNSVTSIGERAFEYCRSLTSVTIPNSVTSIGELAFDDCRSLTSVTIGNSVSSIGGLAFYYCSGLTSINVESGNQHYDSRNNCNAIIETASNTLIVGCKNTTIPNGVTSIGRYAFAYCYGLTSVTIPNSVTSIGNYAFNDCRGLKSVIIPNSVTSIGSGTFQNCNSLTSITIPNSVTSIGSSAFYGCISLTSVTIPNSVTSIGNGAFTTCTALKSAIIGNGVTSIGSAFGHCINLQEMILSQAAYDNGIPESVTKFMTYSKNPMRVEVVSKGVVSATMKIFPIDEQGNTNENNYYTVTTSGQTPGQYIKWKLDDENYGIISEKTEGTLTLVTQPAQPTNTTKARLIATVNETDDDQHFGFEWLRNDAPDNMPANMVSAPLYNGHIIGSLGGLNPDIYYKYRAFYKSDAGEMVYGEWVPFLTGDANVFFEPEVHTKDAIVTNDGALLSAVFIEGTEDIQEKGFEYWPKNSNARGVSLTRGNNIGSIIVSGNNTSVTIEGLKAGTEYGYRPYVKTASGTTYGEEKTFVTSMFGDVNGDNKVDHDDLNDLVSYIMGNNPEHFDKDAADLNNDKKVNAADIVKMVKILK